MSENAFNRPRCELHDKVLYHNRKEAVKTLVGGMNSRRVRVYPCEEHRGFCHLTKESIKYRNK